ncbi:hypothetical protein ONS95_009975 [Cadophora gregata]|uniref:uncharacterized protein n=1 Tax=Cadophora gregata TaxID=51156 RepID=UPI0026DB0090|nr:uncharacterized protein ONS95_009975 [Cadophora gregata]KAK0121690.1 hypothetical protein ONS95_009975 [Cadophora gregata]KAK0127167.1 hypothetical protein ONS96_006720 [Cadophora gregata f. sp. sojae]
MPPLSSTIMALQGLFGILNGAASLISSALQKNLETLQIDSVPAIHAISLGSVSIGAFYINAAYRKDRPIMWVCVLGRGMAVPVFMGHGGPWRNVAAFEAVCGLSIAGALVWEQWGKESRKVREE